MAAPATSPNALLDLIELASKGVHSGVDPKALPLDQLWFAVNVTCRGGHPASRPPLQKLDLSFENETTQTNATEARFQGAAFYESWEGKNCILASIGGRIFKFAISNNNVSVSDISIAGDLNNPKLEQAWLFQGEDFMVINDGESLPLFFDGTTLRRSKGSAFQELPVGCMGHYCNGRISMALPELNNPNIRRTFIAGDLVGGSSGTAQYNFRDSILRTTENQTILGGATFAIPLTAGNINAMFSVAIPDTSLGQGPLQIGTRKGVFSVDLPLDATLWTTTQQPTAIVSLPSYGPISQDSVAVINGDAWYRAVDGIRSFSVARRDFNTWVQTPLSSEVDAVLPLDTQSLLFHTSGVEFDNRLLVTCSPYRVLDRGIAHRGLVALDFNNVSSITSRSNPDYDGLWTGLNILKVLTGDFDGTERCFVFALDADNGICLYESLPTKTRENFDWNGEVDVPIESWLISNALFGHEAAQDPRRIALKKLLTGDLFLEELAGNVQFEVKYRSDQYPFWTDWKDFSICAPAIYCPEDCEPFEEVQKQYATYKRLPEPADTCNEVTRRLLRTGYSFQVRIQWTGRAKLTRMLVWAEPMRETISSCPT